MTLAMHGKTNRRRLVLLVLAVMAVGMAGVAGMSWSGSASAVPGAPTDRQVTIKKLVYNVPTDTTSFAIKDGATSVGNVSMGTPLPLTVNFLAHTYTETVPAGYSFLAGLAIPNTLDGDCEAEYNRSGGINQVEALSTPPSVVLPADPIPQYTRYTLCFVNIKTTITVTVMKDYLLHGGLKEVPVVHVNDGTDHKPAVAGSGNNETHSQWDTVTATPPGGTLITVWEAIDTSKWVTTGPPTISGFGCREAPPLQVAVEDIIEDAGAIVFLVPNLGAQCVITFHNEQKGGTPSTPVPTTPTQPPFNPCPSGCVPVTTPTPTPTLPPPTPTVVPPTPTVVPPTATATKPPAGNVGGSNPGVVVTPAAPSAGGGHANEGSSTNLLLALVMMFSLSGAFALFGYATKRR